MAGVIQRHTRSAWRGVLSSPALTLNGYVAFALPRTVTALGMSLLLGLGAVHVYLWATRPALPNYFLVYSAVLIVGCLTATSAMAWGVNPRVPQLGWYLGSSICLAFLVVYLASRVVGLPGLDTLTGRWDLVPGTFAMVFAAGFVAVHTTVLSGINVAYPQQRHWYD